MLQGHNIDARYIVIIPPENKKTHRMYALSEKAASITELLCEG